MSFYLSKHPGGYWWQAVGIHCFYEELSVHAHVIGVKKTAGFLHDFTLIQGVLLANTTWGGPEPPLSMCVNMWSVGYSVDIKIPIYSHLITAHLTSNKGG